MGKNDVVLIQIFAKNLKRILEMRDIEQKKLAADLGFSTATVSDWVNGNKYPKPANMQKLADYLNCKVSDLRDEPSDSNLINITGMVPVYGVIPAGFPQVAEQYIEDYLPVTVPHPQEYMCLKVKGDSMVGAGIPSGCKVLIHMQHTAQNGQIVACRVNGDEATLKRFKQQGDTVLLMPENPNYEPKIVPASDFLNDTAEIIGVVKQIIIDI